MPRILLVLFAFLCLAPLCAQETTFADLIAGKAAPLTIKAKTLTPGWVRLRTGSQPGVDDISRAFTAMIGGGQLGAYYTKGETLTLEGEKFLIAYSQPVPVNPGGNGGGGPDQIKFDPLTPETDLVLSLLKIKALGSLLDIQPVDLTKEIANVAALTDKQAQAASMNNLRQVVSATFMFAQDHGETTPTAKEWEATIANMPEATCKQPRFNTPYLYNTAIAGRTLGALVDPDTTVCAYEANTWPDGKRAAGFVDGHVQMMPEADLLALLKKNPAPKKNDGVKDDGVQREKK